MVQYRVRQEWALKIISTILNGWVYGRVTIICLPNHNLRCFRYVGEDLGANMGGLINMGDAKCPHQVIRPFLTKELFLPGPRPSLALGYVVRDPGVRNCQKPEIAI